MIADKGRVRALPENCFIVGALRPPKSLCRVRINVVACTKGGCSTRMGVGVAGMGVGVAGMGVGVPGEGWSTRGGFEYQGMVGVPGDGWSTRGGV